MIYRLVGLFNPVEQNCSGPAFLVPYFSTEGSNRSFVQDLHAETRRIESFLRFDIEVFSQFAEDVDLQISAQVGELGILSFRTKEGAIVVGRVDEMLKKIPRHIYQGSPAFDLSALYLIRRYDKIPAVVRRARKLFLEGAAADTWAKLEIRYANGLSRANRREKKTRELVATKTQLINSDRVRARPALDMPLLNEGFPVDAKNFQDLRLRGMQHTVDGRSHINIWFEDCVIVFSGGDLPTFERCQFKDCWFRIKRSAVNKVQYLKILKDACPDYLKSLDWI